MLMYHAHTLPFLSRFRLALHPLTGFWHDNREQMVEEFLAGA